MVTKKGSWQKANPKKAGAHKKLSPAQKATAKTRGSRRQCKSTPPLDLPFNDGLFQEAQKVQSDDCNDRNACKPKYNVTHDLRPPCP